MLKLFFFNVGHGDSIAILFPNNSWGIIDCQKNFNAVEPNVLTFLKNNQIKQLEFLCITHPHLDHFYGADDIVEYFKENIKYFILYGMRTGHKNENSDNSCLVKAIKKFVTYNRVKYKDKIWLIKKDEEFNIEDVNVFCHNPSIKQIESIQKTSYVRESDYNNLSVVFRLKYNDIQVLFTGDASGSLLAQISNNIPGCQVVKIAHHGSLNTNTDGVLNGLISKGSYSIISAGNKYGCPNVNVIDCLKNKLGSIVLLTTDIGKQDVVNLNVDLGQTKIMQSLLDDINDDRPVQSIPFYDGCIKVCIDDSGFITYKPYEQLRDIEI